MKASKPFGFLGGAGKPAEDTPEDGRVVELFRSRAELRKQQEELNEILQRMRDRLKQQEAATGRVQEMLESLERRLESADSGLSTLVFYHLRSLWHDGREMIAQVVRELSARHEERERKAYALEGNRRQFAQRQALEQKLRQAESAFVGARQALVAFDARLARLDRWWHRWERPRLAAQRPALASHVEQAERDLHAARAQVGQLDKAGAGDFPGISVEAKRAINIAAISCAEVLCLRLSKTSLVAQARAAMSRREPTAHYGDLAACVSMMGEVVKARHQLRQRNGLMQEMAPRGERLMGTVAYLGEFEAVPVPESCGIAEGDVLAHGSFGVTSAKLPNVLAEDTWELSRVLLR
jgi:hypothetical protein